MEATRTVGVGVFVRKGGRLLVGKLGPTRGPADGCWSLPGARAQGPESVVQAALRAVQDEAGLACLPVRGPVMSVPGLVAVTDHAMEVAADLAAPTHLTFWVVVDHSRGDPRVLDRALYREWRWVYPDWLFQVPGAEDPSGEQFQWTPVPMFRRNLGAYFQI